MFEETYEAGKLLKVSDFTDIDGRTRDMGNIVNGKGVRTNYTPEGKRYSEGPYSEGLPNGQWTFYDEKERKLSAGMLVNGVKEGEWRIYSRTGRAIRIESYSNGELIDSRWR